MLVEGPVGISKGSPSTTFTPILVFNLLLNSLKKTEIVYGVVLNLCIT